MYEAYYYVMKQKHGPGRRLSNLLSGNSRMG
jgi:hypothetical protein